jgi:hypothetical protein
MYIDPHTEFRYDNDQKQARITMWGLLVTALILCAWMIEIIKCSPSLG